MFLGKAHLRNIVYDLVSSIDNIKHNIFILLSIPSPSHHFFVIFLYNFLIFPPSKHPFLFLIPFNQIFLFFIFFFLLSYSSPQLLSMPLIVNQLTTMHGIAMTTSLLSPSLETPQHHSFSPCRHTSLLMTSPPMVLPLKAPFHRQHLSHPQPFTHTETSMVSITTFGRQHGCHLHCPSHYAGDFHFVMLEMHSMC